MPAAVPVSSRTLLFRQVYPYKRRRGASRPSHVLLPTWTTTETKTSFFKVRFTKTETDASYHAAPCPCGKLLVFRSQITIAMAWWTCTFPRAHRHRTRTADAPRGLTITAAYPTNCSATWEIFSLPMSPTRQVPLRAIGLLSLLSGLTPMTMAGRTCTSSMNLGRTSCCTTNETALSPKKRSARLTTDSPWEYRLETYSARAASTFMLATCSPRPESALLPTFHPGPIRRNSCNK